MVYLFLGTDSISRKIRIVQIAKELDGEVAVFWPDDELPKVDEMIAPTLFGGSKIFLMNGGTGNIDIEKDLPKLAKSIQTFIISEDKLDKRKTSTQAWLKSDLVKLEKFDPPSNSEIPNWIVGYCKSIGCNIDLKSARLVSQKVCPQPLSAGRFNEIPADMQRIATELDKLAAYAGNDPVNEKVIDDVIIDYREPESFDIANALAERNLPRALIAMEQFFNTSNINSTDEKGKNIQLNSLLAEQFRNILMIQDFMGRQVPETEILAQTGWKSGRLFLIKKLAGKFKSEQIQSALEKMYQLDIELKSSLLPGQVILTLIAAQLS